MKQSWQTLRRPWLYAFFCIALIAVIYLLYFRLLYPLTGGLYSARELASQNQSSSLRTILHMPLNAPYELVVWLGLKLGHHSLLVTRVTAVLFAIPLAGLFYWVARHWFSTRVAAMGTIMFASSSGFLHFARFGSAEILQMAPLVLLSCIFAYRHIALRFKRLAAYALVITATCMLYIPVMVWFALIGLALLWRRYRPTIQAFGTLHTTLMVGLALAVLTPLIYQCVQYPAILRALFGIPDSLPSLTGFGKELVHTVSSIGYRGYWPADYWMHGAPLLTIGEVVLLLAGLSILVRRPMVRGNYYLLAVLLLGGLLVALRASATMALLVPFIYFVVTAGLHLLDTEWRNVFPRNVFAQGLSTALLVVLVAFSVFYHYRAYFVAWPQSPETKTVYSVKQPS